MLRLPEGIFLDLYVRMIQLYPKRMGDKFGREVTRYRGKKFYGNMVDM